MSASKPQWGSNDERFNVVKTFPSLSPVQGMAVCHEVRARRTLQKKRSPMRKLLVVSSKRAGYTGEVSTARWRGQKNKKCIYWGLMRHVHLFCLNRILQTNVGGGGFGQVLDKKKYCATTTGPPARRRTADRLACRSTIPTARHHHRLGGGAAAGHEGPHSSSGGGGGGGGHVQRKSAGGTASSSPRPPSILPFRKKIEKFWGGINRFFFHQNCSNLDDDCTFLGKIGRTQRKLP